MSFSTVATRSRSAEHATRNPHPEETQEHEDWTEGWDDAKAGAKASAEGEPIYGEDD